MSRHDRSESPDEIRDSTTRPRARSSRRQETSDARGPGGASETFHDQPPRYETRPSKVRSAPKGQRTRHPDLDRDRTYIFRDSELKTLRDIGTFRVLKLDDLVAHRYGGAPAKARRDLDNLLRQGLILRRTTHPEQLDGEMKQKLAESKLDPQTALICRQAVARHGLTIRQQLVPALEELAAMCFRLLERKPCG